MSLHSESLTTNIMQFKYHQRVFQQQSLTGSGQAEADRGRPQGGLEVFADLPLGLVLVKASHGVQFGHPHIHPGPKEAATNCASFVALNRLPMANHKPYLTLVCTRMPPKKPQKQRTQWPASDNIRTGNRIQLVSQVVHTKGNLGRNQKLMR